MGGVKTTSDLRPGLQETGIISSRALCHDLLSATRMRVTSGEKDQSRRNNKNSSNNSRPDISVPPRGAPLTHVDALFLI